MRTVTPLMTEMASAGIRLLRDGDALRVEIPAGVTIDAYRERLAKHKPAILTELLQREILEAAAAMGDAFDRDAWSALWARWYALRDQQRSRAPDAAPMPCSPVIASLPPAGWDGALCDGCPWSEFCRVLGPRAPHLPGGPCAAWPIESATEVCP
jgi:hypothetical protein